MSERERGLFGVWSRLAQRIGGRETHILIENWGGGAGERDCLNRSEREGDECERACTPHTNKLLVRTPLLHKQ